MKIFFEQELDTDQIESIETTSRVIVDKNIHITRWLRLIPGNRAEKVKRRCTERPDGVRVVFKPRYRFVSVHENVLSHSLLFFYAANNFSNRPPL